MSVSENSGAITRFPAASVALTDKEVTGRIQ